VSGDTTTWSAYRGIRRIFWWGGKFGGVGGGGRGGGGGGLGVFVGVGGAGYWLGLGFDCSLIQRREWDEALNATMREGKEGGFDV